MPKPFPGELRGPGVVGVAAGERRQGLFELVATKQPFPKETLTCLTPLLAPEGGGAIAPMPCLVFPAFTSLPLPRPPLARSFMCKLKKPWLAAQPAGLRLSATAGAVSSTASRAWGKASNPRPDSASTGPDGSTALMGSASMNMSGHTPGSLAPAWSPASSTTPATRTAPYTPGCWTSHQRHTRLGPAITRGTAYSVGIWVALIASQASKLSSSGSSARAVSAER